MSFFRLLGKSDWEQMARRVNYSTSALAQLNGISIRQLERTFLRTMGRSPEQWINDLRLGDARELLEKGISVKVAAAVSGYNHSQSFSRAFKRFFGIPPSAV